MPDDGDSRNWMDEVRENRNEDQDESREGSSNNWMDEVREQSTDSNETEQRSRNTSEDSTSELTVSTNRFVCDSCGAVTGPAFHPDCGAPFILIGNEWRCSDCGGKVSPNSSCSECGRQCSRPRSDATLQFDLDVRPSEIEVAIHEETNQRRIDDDQNLGTLGYEPHLSAIALQHSRDMAQRNYTEHTSPEGDEPVDRYRAFGHDTQSSGENIARTNHATSQTAQEIGREIVDGWMNSKGHRENILREHFQKEGIGVYIDSDGIVYATQNFY